MIFVSLIVMLMMTAWSLISLFGMVLRATTPGKKRDLLPLSVSISLIFGMPALRNIQPGVPPAEVPVDYIVFIWAELLVAASAVIIVWTWFCSVRSLNRSPGEKRSQLLVIGIRGSHDEFFARANSCLCRDWGVKESTTMATPTIRFQGRADVDLRRFPPVFCRRDHRDFDANCNSP